MLEDEGLQWKAVSGQLKDLRAILAKSAPELLERQTTIKASDEEDLSLEDMVEREPVTIILSAKGWIRAAKGTALG